MSFDVAANETASVLTIKKANKHHSGVFNCILNNQIIEYNVSIIGKNFHNA